MLVPTCNPKPLLGFGSIEHRARRFCETIPRTRTGPSRKPDSALSRHPSPGPEAPGPLGAAPTSPAREECLRRDILACSHRSFTWPVPRGIPPVGSYPTLSPITCAGRGYPLSGHRLVCSLLHLTWRRACAAPPLGFLAR